MKELNNEKLNKVVGGSGVANTVFQIGDWVSPKKTRLSPQGMQTYFRIDDIEDANTSMPTYVVNAYVKDVFDGSITKIYEVGRFMADELDYGHDPTATSEL